MAAGPLGRLKSGIKHLVGIEPTSYVTPLPDLEWLGSGTHGYMLPRRLLHAGSVCYCVGAGDDITFDTELARIYGCRVFVIDPTPEGREHFMQVRDAIRAGTPISSTNGNPFRYRIGPDRFDLLTYIEIGVTRATGTMRFYEPTRKNYIGHSVVMFKESGRYIELPVDRLSRIMARHGHAGLDLLKLEIEGAEYQVIESAVEDELDIKAILVEYDEVFHSRGKGHLLRIRASTRLLLRAGYRLAHSTSLYKRLFVREDVFEKLEPGAPIAQPHGRSGEMT